MTKVLEEGYYGIKLIPTDESYDLLVDVFQNDGDVDYCWEVLIKSENGELREQWIGEEGEKPTQDVVDDLVWEYMTTFYSSYGYYYSAYSTKLEKFTDEESQIILGLEVGREIIITDPILGKKLEKLFPENIIEPEIEK